MFRAGRQVIRGHRRSDGEALPVLAASEPALRPVANTSLVSVSNFALPAGSGMAPR
jgi:hypothetical protein